MSLYKITVLGTGGVGKTAVTIRLCSNHFVEYYDPTIENSYRRQIMIDGEVAVLDILDTAGQEEFSAMRAQWIRQGEGFVLMYSIDKKEAFHYVKVLHDLVLKTIDVDKAEAPAMAIVGNKVDLEREGQREVSTEEGQQLATGLGCLFFEASAKEMINVEETFLELTRAIRKRSKAQADAEADADGAAGGTKKKKGRGSSIILKKQCLLF